MKKKHTESDYRDSSTDLHRRAEDLLRKQSDALNTVKPAEAKRLLNKLQTLQIELELQSEDLRRAQNELAERRQIEDALRENEQRLALIYNTVGDIIFQLAVEPEGQFRFVSVNPAFLRVTGLSREMVVGKTVNEVIPEPSLTFVLAKYRQAIEENAIVSWEEISDYPTGWLIGEVSIAPVFDNNSTCIHLIGSVHDVTERKRMENALRESEEWFRTMADITTTAIFIFQGERVVYANHAGEVLSGYSLEDFSTLRFWDVIHPDYRDIVRERGLARQRGEQVPDSYEVRIVCQDGSERWIDYTAGWISWQGQPAIIGTAFDITERKRVEKALRISETKFKVLTEQSITGICLIQEGFLVYVNPRLAEILEFRQEEMIGLPIFDLVAEKDRELVRENLRKRLSGEVSNTNYNVHALKKGGAQVPMEVHGSVIEYLGHPAIMGIMLDITERQRAEETLQLEKIRLQAQLELHKRLDAPRDQLFDFSVETLTQSTKSLFAFIGLMDQAEAVMTIHAWSKNAMAQCAMETKPKQFPIAEAGLWGECVRQRQPVIINTYADLPDKRGIPTGHVQIDRFLAVPIFDGEKIVAVAAVANKADDYNESDCTAVIILINMLWDILRRQLAENSLKQSHEQLRALAGHVEAAREEERTRIAREVHDQLGQMLTALKLDLKWIAGRLPADEVAYRDKVTAMLHLIDDTIGTVRRVSAELRPGLLDDLGLMAAIEWQVQEFAGRTGLDYELALDEENVVLDQGLATALFRILQEALTNVARHAGATRIRVAMDVGPDGLALTITDNGKGMTDSQASALKSLGLLGMRERVRAWGGEVTFHGIPMQGTTVTVRIPIGKS
jgi:PAS domain S-box-containing protein